MSHLAKWEEYLNRYGSDLRRSPETLRVMILQVLPKDMAEKLRLKREKYPTFQTILAYVRDRAEERREVAKAEALHQPKKSNRVSAMTGEQTQATYLAAAARAQTKKPNMRIDKASDQTKQGKMPDPLCAAPPSPPSAPTGGHLPRDQLHQAPKP